MLHWIFDLDYTLYDIPIEVNFDYDLLNEDVQLSYLLKKLPFNKFIFTNGTFDHGLTCLEIMKIINNFDIIIGRDTINDLKPNISCFKKFMNLTNIKQKDKCIFF